MPDAHNHDIAAVFERHFEAVYAYVAYRTAPDTHAAADITQEVFVDAARTLSGFRGNSSMLTWLRSMARRKVADHFRTAAQRDRLTDGWRDALAARAGADDAERAEQTLRVSQALQKLTEDQVELLELKYLEGCPVRDIAASRGATEKAIESALSRARATFREHYTQLLNAEEA